ncbi:rod shape-determining protein MreC [Candidatus Igneacidithiobacillus taiwanensis]|uniref:rod shape-determining protein MreC n=1 Tax=Candidatus Igneacidithiobacillus taiwanensis TaxID=1945924 RepID=UPI00289CCC84|nr:rod shape-determining protein MreC [Candidatus Igneacidithiobacillus taiwanensis]MCE5360187.1 rod shape-determining protein MreC [Acidithiobacillus sp.]
MSGLPFIRPLPSLLRVLILATLSVGVSLYSVEHPNLRQLGLNAAEPLLWLNGQLRDAWQVCSQYLQTQTTLRRENAALRQRLQVLEMENLALPVLRTENQQLLALLDSFPTAPGRVAVAQIEAQNLRSGSQQITINLGAAEGVYVGQPALAPGGVIGQVVTVSRNNARISLLSDLSSAIPAKPLGGNYPCLVEGRGDLHSLSVPFQPHATPLVPGTELVTSGLGGRFPPGLPLGVVKSVEHASNGPFARVLVRPSANLAALNTILLLWPQTRNASHS